MYVFGPSYYGAMWRAGDEPYSKQTIKTFIWAIEADIRSGKVDEKTGRLQIDDWKRRIGENQ